MSAPLIVLLILVGIILASIALGFLFRAEHRCYNRNCVKCFCMMIKQAKNNR